MKIQIGIISSTHIDRDGQRMAKEALEGMVQQIKEKYIPLDIEHRGTYIGVVLSAKIRKFEDGEYALLGIMGVFENEEEKEKFLYGSPNTVFDEYLKELDILGSAPLSTTAESEIDKAKINKSYHGQLGLSVGFH